MHGPAYAAKAYDSLDWSNDTTTVTPFPSGLPRAQWEVREDAPAWRLRCARQAGRPPESRRAADGICSSQRSEEAICHQDRLPPLVRRLNGMFIMTYANTPAARAARQC